jgi:hypothetical protein
MRQPEPSRIGLRSETYDIPQDVLDGPHSPAFRHFLFNWFSGNRISFNEQLNAANELTPEETRLGQELIRRNLKCKHSHIISGTWVLGDMEAIPLLRSMFAEEDDESRRLLIAGALWKLNKDPIFIECLNQAKKRGLLKVYFHLQQVLWLNDERAVDFLIDLLPETDQDHERARRLRRLNRWFFHTPLRRITLQMLRRHNDSQGAASWALSLLNHLQAGHLVPPDEERPPSYYGARRNDQAFRELMTEAVHKSIAQAHQGR